MKRKFILRVMAWLLAVAMLLPSAGVALTAHAEGTVLHTGKITFSDSGWWTQKEISMSDLIGNASPKDVEQIVFKSNTTFTLGYNNNSGDGTAAADNPYWTQFDSTASSYSVSNVVLDPYTDKNGSVHEYFLMLALSKADGVDYTIEWTVYGKGGAPAKEEEKPATPSNAAHKGSITFSDSGWWTQKEIGMSELLGSVSPKAVKNIVFKSNTTFTIGYNNNSGDGTVDADNPYWTQYNATSNSYDLSNVALEPYTDKNGEVHEYFLMLALSKADGVEYTIEWEVFAEKQVGPTSTPTPTPTNTPTPTPTCTPTPTPIPKYTNVGDTLVVTADMVKDGVATISNAQYKKIEVPGGLGISKIIFNVVDLDTLVLEGGADYEVVLSRALIEDVKVTAPKLDIISFDELEELMAKAEDASAVVNAWYEGVQKKNAAAKAQVKLTAEDSEIDKLEVNANARIDVTDAQVASLTVDTEDALSRMEVKVYGFNGEAKLNLNKGDNTFGSPLSLGFVNSAVKSVAVSGEETCSINGTRASIGELKVAGAENVVVDVATEKLVVDADSAKVRVYSDVETLEVKGSANDIVLPASASVENATVSGDNVRIYGMGSLGNAEITGKGANVATIGTAVEGANDKTIPQAMIEMMPTAAPKPTATPTPVPLWAHSGSVTLTDTSWWTSTEVSLSDLLGDVAPEEVGSIVFKSNTTFSLGYNNTTGTSTEVADNPYWTQFNSTDTKYTVTDMALVPFTDPTGEEREYGMFLALSKGDGVPYKITWEVYTKDSMPEEDEEEPTETGKGSVTLSDSTWWTTMNISMTDLLAGVAAADVESITFSSNTSFILGYNNNTGDAPVVNEGDNPYWTQVNDSNSYTVSNVVLDDYTDPAGEVHQYYLIVGLSKGDGVEYTIDWVVNVKTPGEDGGEGGETPGGENPEGGEKPGGSETPDGGNDEEEKLGEGSITFSDSGWWTPMSITKEELLAGVAAADVESITFTGNTSFVLGYKNNTGDVDGDDPYWTQVSDADTYTVSNVVLDDFTAADGGVHQYSLMVALSKGDGVEYTISWKVNVRGTEGEGETEGESTKGVGSISFSDSGWWTPMSITKEELLAGVAAADVESITFTGNTSFVLGYKNNTGDVDGDDPYWTQVSDADTYTVSNVVLDDFTAADGGVHQYSLMVALSKGDGVEYTISWKVNLKSEATEDGDGSTVVGPAARGELTFSDSGWWTTKNIAKEDLLAGVDAAEVEYIIFNSDTSFILGYNNTSGDVEGENPYWTQVSDANSYTVSNMVLDAYTDPEGGVHEYTVMLGLSKGDGVEYTITWEVYTK